MLGNPPFTGLFCNTGVEAVILIILLYTIYINEITVLSKIMDTEMYKATTNTNQVQTYSNFIKHFILNYVDDSSNVVSSRDPKCLQNYINDFFRLLENFYNANRLTINRDKSKLLITCKNKLRNSSKKLNYRHLNILSLSPIK